MPGLLNPVVVNTIANTQLRLSELVNLTFDGELVSKLNTDRVDNTRVASINNSTVTSKVNAAGDIIMADVRGKKSKFIEEISKIAQQEASKVQTMTGNLMNRITQLVTLRDSIQTDALRSSGELALLVSGLSQQISGNIQEITAEEVVGHIQESLNSIQTIWMPYIEETNQTGNDAFLLEPTEVIPVVCTYDEPGETYTSPRKSTCTVTVPGWPWDLLGYGPHGLYEAVVYTDGALCLSSRMLEQLAYINEKLNEYLTKGDAGIQLITEFLTSRISEYNNRIAIIQADIDEQQSGYDAVIALLPVIESAKQYAINRINNL